MLTGGLTDSSIKSLGEHNRMVSENISFEQSHDQTMVEGDVADELSYDAIPSPFDYKAPQVLLSPNSKTKTFSFIEKPISDRFSKMSQNATRHKD
jgi:hypothetical protein